MAHLRCAQTSTGEQMMQLGIHLPHAGSQATPALIKRHAQRAEALGLSDVWVSEHIIVPRAQFPRSPLFYDPILTLTWVASVTERVRLGTSVIVLPMRHPLPLAKELATLHIGDGWHGSQVTPEQAGEVVKRLRRDRPEPGFTISVRSHWDGKDVGMMRERVTAYAAIGVQHVMVHPQDREIDDWDTVIEGVGRLTTG